MKLFKFAKTTVLGAVLLALTGCGVLANPNTPQDSVLTAEAVVCTIKHMGEPIGQVLRECNVATVLETDVSLILALVGDVPEGGRRPMRARRRQVSGPCRARDR